ncbi:MAG: DUF5110 domain-containing protein [Lachnospiraceae bacterium]|nr:DUF5110 domain-containing protein [Lachnospiraceae bacterium]
MPKTVENISENITCITYPSRSFGPEGLRDREPVDFQWNGKRVISQTEVSFTPVTVYRYEADQPSLRKKQTANGEVAFTDSLVKIPAYEAFSVNLEFRIGNDELLLGMGQYEDGICDHRNRTEYLYESNMRIAIPFLVTTGHYGILIDSKAGMIFTSEGDRIRFAIDCAKELKYYIFTGETLGDLIRCYHRTTGMPSMLPRWAFGYIQSKERYKTGAELEEVVSAFRSKNIPIDCIVQDWFSWEEGLWGEKKFDKKRYPNLSATVKKIHEDHVHFMVSIWPNMSTDSENYAQFAKEGLLLPNSNLYDAFCEEARALYWKQICEEIMSSETDALWCDNAEPFSDADWSGAEKKSEEERYRVVKEMSVQSMDPEKMNAYGLYHAGGIYENWRRDIAGKRVVNLTRSGYTGIQKYGTILWSGDICATYDTLRRQIVEGIRMGLTGMPYWTLDIGGFFVVDDKYENRGCNDHSHQPLWFWHGDYNDGVLDAGYRELYVRWLAFGTFLPIFRSHGTDTPREPWQFGSKGDPFYDAIEEQIRLRYRLMPYIYSLGALAHREGEAMMRSLLMDFYEDENVRTVCDEYLFGPAFLVAPVYTPMYYQKGSVEIRDSEKTRRVYLPKGCGWYDYYSCKYYEGGCWIDVDAPLDRIPVFVREGSIIPMSSGLSYADEGGGLPDVIRVYEGCDGEFTLYLDEGDGYAFEDGVYCDVRLSYSEHEHKLSVSKSGSYPVDLTYNIEYIKKAG